jgi:hypothetical protein
MEIGKPTSSMWIQVSVLSMLVRGGPQRLQIESQFSIQGFHQWLTNSSLADIATNLGCTKQTAQRIRAGTMKSTTLHAWGDRWLKTNLLVEEGNTDLCSYRESRDGVGAFMGVGT